MIEIENLTKTFGTQTVISDVSGIFYPGKIYGFVGRNGSGKTVLMKMILGFIKPTSGTIKVNGKHVGKYSLGMRQRLGIAQAIMEDPQILLLDEPLNGLDNEGVEEMRNVLLKQKEQGKLIIIASHSKEDIDILCDEIFRFDHGKIIGHEVRG